MTSIEALAAVLKAAIETDTAYSGRVFYLQTDDEAKKYVEARNVNTAGIIYEGMIGAGGPGAARGSAEAVFAIIIPVVSITTQAQLLGHWTRLDHFRSLVVHKVAGGHKFQFVLETKLVEKGDVSTYIQRWKIPAFVI